MDPKFIFIYCVTVFVASITPGPSMLLALNHGIKYGARRTVASALGNVTATLIQALLSLAGLGAVLLHSAPVFNLIKFIGAGYLIFIGLKMFFASGLNLDVKANELSSDRKFRDLFVEAFIVTIGNPKAIIFFTALFPQFINTQKDTFLQSFIILSLLLIIAFICMMIYGFFGQKVTVLLNKTKIKKIFNRLVGGTFIGMGIVLATEMKE